MNRVGRRLGAIALLALVVRAIVPAGFMLAHADTGSGRYLTLRLCDSHSSAVQIIDLDTGKRVDLTKLPGKAEQKHAPCVFSAAIPMAQPEAMADPVAFRTTQDVGFALVRDLRPGRGIPAPPPPSTGPPSTI
jgi:hypothetical protein